MSLASQESSSWTRSAKDHVICRAARYLTTAAILRSARTFSPRMPIPASLTSSRAVSGDAGVKPCDAATTAITSAHDSVPFAAPQALVRPSASAPAPPLLELP